MGIGIAIVAFVLGLVLLVITANALLHILGWVLLIAAVVAVLFLLFGGRNRANL